MIRKHGKLVPVVRLTLPLLCAAAACGQGLGPAPSVRGGLDPDGCLFCHGFRGLSRYDAEADRAHAYFVDPDYFHSLAGAHARLACTDCHERAEVSVIPHQPVTRVDCTRTCHVGQAGGVTREFSHAHIAERLGESVHGPDVLRDIRLSRAPLLESGQSICLYCHDEPLFRISGESLRVLTPRAAPYDRCRSCHTEQLDTDTAYYLRHIASRLQPARSTLELTQVCAVCHADERVLADHGLTNTVASYLKSFHGKAAMLGDAGTADCLSCHAASPRDVHTVLSRDDPESSVFPARVASTCSTIACHPGATPRFGSAAVHLDLPTSSGTIEYLVAVMFIVLTVLTFGPSALFCLLELFQAVIGRGHGPDERTRRLLAAVRAHPQGRKKLVRFSVWQRVQHWLLAVLFLALVVTGFPLKFADAAWSRAVIAWFGGLHAARAIHHVAGLALVVGFLLHLGYFAGRVWKRARAAAPGAPAPGLLPAVSSLPMWITRRDLRHLYESLLYWLLIRKTQPRFGKFSLKEKFEYLGVFWGTMLLGLTGVLLWGEQLASHIFGGRLFNIAAIAHTYEAFLAVIHVGIVHIYSVVLAPHVFPMSMATITGETPEYELAEGHAAFVDEVANELGVKLMEGNADADV